MPPAAFTATYADWRVIKGRKVVQVCFELPLEAADAAYQALGGMPIAAKEVWCGIARIDPEAANRKDGEVDKASSVSGREPAGPHITPPRPSAVPASAAGADKERRPFNSLPYPQQAALRCNDPVFWAFLREMCAADAGDVRNEEQAKQAIYKICDVGSRANIKPDTEAEGYWLALTKWFETWLLKERVA